MELKQEQGCRKMNGKECSCAITNFNDFALEKLQPILLNRIFYGYLQRN